VLSVNFQSSTREYSKACEMKNDGRGDSAGGPNRLQILDALRGLAALGVCALHFASREDAMPISLVRNAAQIGWYGVPMFFVISGFIIPYSLKRNGYRLMDYGKFLLKRIIRLDPPYLVSILLCIVLGYLASATPGYSGPAFRPSVLQVILHLGYLNVFFGYPWLNGIYWTLAIEIQYYVVIGLLFPLIASPRREVRTAILGLVAVLAFLSSDGRFIVPWLFLFLIGIITFEFHCGMVDRSVYLLWLASFAAGASYVNGPAVAASGVATSLLLAFVKIKSPAFLLFFGEISYSLYLVHLPLGNRVINLGLRYAHSPLSKVALEIIAFVIVTSTAWLLYKYVEKPSQRWSSTISFKTKSKPKLVVKEVLA
jgi:peptidoglycan/LPS O-acetylase OafA/YrhL